MGFLFVEMLRNPGAFEKLQQEIDSIELEDGQTLFHHSQVKTLPYLNASIDETLRMHPANPGGLPRKAVSDTVLGGKVRVPKNVSQTHLAYKLTFS
jgi:benzoate 4-monooxygenase